MCRRVFLFPCAALVLLLAADVSSTTFAAQERQAAAQPKEEPAFTRQEDVIYGRKYGTALTMDVFTPKKANGAGVVFAVSGGWFSDRRAINVSSYREFLRRGYTVFAVVHGSQPRFTIPEAVEDMHRAVRYVRYHVKDFHFWAPIGSASREPRRAATCR